MTAGKFSKEASSQTLLPQALDLLSRLDPITSAAGIILTTTTPRGFKVKSNLHYLNE